MLSDPTNVVWKVAHGLMDMITKTTTKTLRKISLWFFRAVYHSKTHVISHPVIAAILEVILNILQRWKQHQHSS